MLIIIIFLVYISYIFSLSSNNFVSNDNDNNIAFILSNDQDNLDINIYKEDLNNLDILKDSYDNCNIEIKNVVKLVQNNIQSKRFYKYILLEGPSSSGKSTLARAIAVFGFKIPYLFIPSTSLLSHHRNKTAKNIKNLFNTVSNLNQDYIIILDEINVLTDNYQSDYNDIAETSKSLWICLDSIENNGRLFLIGTTNDATKMPFQLKERFINKIFYVDNPSINYIKNLLFYHIFNNSNKNDLNISLSKDNIEEFSYKLIGFSIRDIIALVNYAYLYSTFYNNKILDTNVLNISYNYTKSNKDKLCNFVNISNDEKRHKELLSFNLKYSEIFKEQNNKLLSLQKSYYYSSLFFSIVGISSSIIAFYLSNKNFKLKNKKIFNNNNNNNK